MKENVKFYQCPICGNIIGLIEGNVEHITCCGKPMEEMIANTTDASVEKHVPVYERVEDELVVRVGEVEHPMEKEHYIEWISLQTKNGNQRVVLKPNDEPKACFKICDGDVIEAVYAYCNLHSLWIAK